MNQAVIFDMDGLMIASTSTWKIAEVNFLKIFGVEYDEYIAKSYQGMRVSGVVERMIDAYRLPISQREAEHLFNQQFAYSYRNPDLSLLPGCKELIHSLYSSRMFRLAIASSSPMFAIKAVVKRFSIGRYFDFLVSGEDVQYGKPAPDIFLRCSRLLNLTPKSCLVLEDAPNGVQAAQKAGMSVIAVYKYGLHNADDFKNITENIVSSLIDVDIDMIYMLLEKSENARYSKRKDKLGRTSKLSLLTNKR